MITRFTKSLKWIVLAGLLLPFSNTMAQSCLPNGITLDTQSQIDSFPINYPGCVTVMAHVLIFPVTPGAITNLNALAQLTTIAGQLWINDNASLTTLNGLHNITSVGSHLRVRYNSQIEDLDGLNGLATVGGELDISNNSKLLALTGLNALTSVGTNANISNNGLLEDLTGLTNLLSIGGYLAIAVDTMLQDLVGIDNIDHTTITSLQLVNSKRLKKCNVESICDFLSIPTNFASIGGNGFGCASRTQVENNCAAQTGIGENPSISVSIYPNPASNYLVVTGDITPKAQLTLTDSKGKLLDSGLLGNGYIDILHLAPGIYFVGVLTADGATVQRIVKTGR